MKFNYFKIDLPEQSKFFGQSVLRPIIPIKVISGAKSTKYTALVDSGADFCIFDAELGEQLGLDVKAGQLEKFSGVEESKGSEAYFHTITINIGGWDYETKAGFSYDIAKQGYAILGQKGFFDQFSVKFDYQKEEIEINEKKSK